MILQVLFYAELETFVLKPQIQLETIAPPPLKISGCATGLDCASCVFTVVLGRYRLQRLNLSVAKCSFRTCLGLGTLQLHFLEFTAASVFCNRQLYVIVLMLNCFLEYQNDVYNKQPNNNTIHDCYVKTEIVVLAYEPRQYL